MSNDSTHDLSQIEKKREWWGWPEMQEFCITIFCCLTMRTKHIFWGTLFHKERWTLDWHLYRRGKARSHAVIKALTLGKKVRSSVIFWQVSEQTRQSNIVTCLVAAGKKNDRVFDCLIARLYLQAIVFGDNDQSCVCIMCLRVSVDMCVVSAWSENLLAPL